MCLDAKLRPINTMRKGKTHLFHQVFKIMQNVLQESKMSMSAVSNLENRAARGNQIGEAVGCVVKGPNSGVKLPGFRSQPCHLLAMSRLLYLSVP